MRREEKRRKGKGREEIKRREERGREGRGGEDIKRREEKREERERERDACMDAWWINEYIDR